MSFYGLWKGWELVDVLGKDDFGAVYTAKVDGEPIDSVVKVVNIPTDAEIIDKMLAEGKSLSDAENILQPIVDSWIDEIISKDTMAGNENVVKIQDYKLSRYPYAPIWIIYIRLEKLSTVKDYFAKNLATSNSVAKLGADISNALEMCGNVNIKKSEVNPSKIYVNDSGTFKLGGFESSKEMTLPGYMESTSSFSDYLAPEVCNGGEVTPLANMYSLGLIMYEQINGGKLPFVNNMNDENERKAALEKRLDKFVSFDAPANSDNALAKIITKATAFAPKERFSSFKEMGRALKAYLEKDFKSLNMIFDGQANEVFESDEKARANSEEAKIAAARAAEEAALLKRQEEAAAKAAEEERKKVEKLKKEHEAAAAKEMDEERKAAEKRDAKDQKLAKARAAEEAKLAEQKADAERKEAEKKEAEEKAAAIAAAVAAKELAKQKEAEEKKKLEDEKKSAKEKAEKQKAEAATALAAKQAKEAEELKKKQAKEAEVKQKAKDKAKKDKADAKAAKKAAKEKAKNDKLLAKQNAKDAKKKAKADKALAAITAKKAAEAEELKRKQAEIEAKNKAEAEKKAAEEKNAKEKAAALAAENAAKELAKQKEAEEKKKLEEERKAAKEKAEQQKAAAAAALAAKQAAEVEELRRRQAEAEAKKRAEAEKKAAEEKATKEKEAKKKAAAIAAATAAKAKVKNDKVPAKQKSKDAKAKDTTKKTTDKKEKSSTGKYIIIALIIIVVIVAFLLILRSCTGSGSGDTTTTGTTTVNPTTIPSNDSSTEPTTTPSTEPTTEPTTEPSTEPTTEPTTAPTTTQPTTTTTTTKPTTTTTKPTTTTQKPTGRPDNSAANRDAVVNGVYTSVDGRFQLDVPGWKSMKALPTMIVPENYANGYDNAIKIERVPYINPEYVDVWTKEMFEQTLNVTINGNITTTTLNGGYLCYKITNAVDSQGIIEHIYVFQTPLSNGINSGRYFVRFMQAEGKPDMKSISEQVMSTIKFF